MISVAGAGLLAQVLPVGVLAVVLELRLVEDMYAVTRGVAVWVWTYGVVGAAILVGSCYSVAACVRAVIANEPLSGGEAVLVSVCSYGLLQVVTLFLLWVMASRFGILDRLASRAMKRVAADPRRLLATLDSIERRYPNATKLSPDARAHLEAEAAAQRPDATQRGRGRQARRHQRRK